MGDFAAVALENRLDVLPPTGPWRPTPEGLRAIAAQERLFLDALNALPKEPAKLRSFHTGRVGTFRPREKPYSPADRGVRQAERRHLKARALDALYPEAGEGRDTARAAILDWAMSPWAGEAAEMQDAAAALFLNGAKAFPGREHASMAQACGERFNPSGNYPALVSRAYDATQRYLEKRGVQEMTLFRGMRWANPTSWDMAPPGVEQLAEGGPGRPPRDSTLLLSPLSSFSADPRVALDFCLHGATLTTVIVLAAATVPAARVASLPMTGFGCFTEAEVVILGGECPVTTFSVDPWPFFSLDDEGGDVMRGHWPGGGLEGFLWAKAKP